MESTKDYTVRRRWITTRDLMVMACYLLSPVIALLCCSFSLLAQEKHMVQVKTFDQQLKPFTNIEISINGKEFVSVGSKGTAFVELQESELPLKSVKVNNDQLEAASWNFSKGIVEIIIRKKSYQIFHLYARDNDNKPLTNLKITFNGKKTISATSDREGRIEIPLALDDKVTSHEQFVIENYTTSRLQLSEKEIVLTASPVKQVVETDAPVVSQKKEEQYFKDFDLTNLDSIQSLTVFYAVFKDFNLKEQSPEVKRKLDEKFSQLVQQLQDSARRENQGFIGKISDSSFVKDDITNLLAQAIHENDLLETQRKDFDEKIRIINEKLTDGGSSMDPDTRERLLSELGRLELTLQENANKFYKNQSDYRDILNSLKEKFFHIETLENQLSESEKQRLEEQRIFRRRIVTISAIVVLFAVLILLLIYFGNKLRLQKQELVKVNAEIKRINENLETIVYERTKMLAETNKELDIFLYKASHDLRSPICSIIGLGNIATHISNPESKELFDRAVQIAHSMDRMLKKLRIISEINQPSNFSPIILLPVVARIRESFLHFIQDYRIKVTVDCPPDLVIHSYPNLIEAILFNLVENALFYCTLKSSGVPQVDFKAEIKHERLEISIYDNGIGIDQAIRKSLFEMFFKGNENSKGNGLGLYIVQKSIQAVGGTIVIESEPNVYTRFVVHIPLAHEAPKRIGDESRVDILLSNLVLSEAKQGMNKPAEPIEAVS
jgi:signal transduction histidine kinase